MKPPPPRALSTILILCGAMLLVSCTSHRTASWVVLDPHTAEAKDTLEIVGTVHYLDLEGGVYVIRDSDGTQYEPLDLPEGFRRDGMLVEVEARRSTDMASTAMAGILIELLRIRALPAEAESTAELWASSWRLEDLAGRGVVDDARATLSFPEPGQVAGLGSCNRFSGTVTIDQDRMRFGPLAATKMACPEAIMDQERRYLAALGRATRFRIDEPFLYVYTTDEEPPLRFIRED